MNKNSWQKIDRYAKKIKSINYLGGKCKMCGDNNIHHLVFHHINNDKEFEISTLKSNRWSKIKEELKKCELLCDNCHQELHYDENATDNRRKSKLIYLEYKGVKCKSCGYDKCEASLSFHHLDPDTKKFCIGNLNERINSLSEIKDYIIDELDKCEIICRNCHREKHTDIDFFNEYKEQIYERIKNIENNKEKQAKIPRKEVYKMFDYGMLQKDIAIYFNASNGTISDILKPYKEIKQYRE